MINTPNWALILLRASSSSQVSASVISFSVSTVWTWLWPFSLWFGKTLRHYLPRCGLKSLTLHLSLGAQPAPLLPNRALSLPLLGPRCVTHEKAQGPGPLLQSHSSSWSFVDSSVHSTGSTRRFWGGVEGGESTSAILPSSQELVHPQSTGLPTPSHRVGSETPGAGFLSALSTIVSSKTNHTL